jgi:hypothetical protein
MFLGLMCLLFKPTIYYSQLLNTTYFNENNGIQGLKAYKITEDSKKNIWLCTELGVYKFDGYSFTEIINTQKVGYEIFDLFCDSDDNIWLGSFSPFLSYIDSNEHLTTIDSNQNGTFRFLESYDRNIIFYYDDNRNLNFYNKNKKKSEAIHKELYFDSTILMKYIKHFKIDSANPTKIYNKLIKHIIKNRKYGEVEVKESIAKKYFPKEIITILYHSSYREIRSNHDFITYLGNETKVYNNQNSRDYFLEDIITKLNLSSSDFGSIHLDSEKNIWITTLSKGIYHINNNYKSNYTIGKVNTESYKIKEINSSIYFSQGNELNHLNLNSRETKVIFNRHLSIKNFIKTKNLILSISNDGFFHDGYNIKADKFKKINLDAKIRNWQIENIKLIGDSIICLFEKEKVLLTELQNDSLVVLNQINIRRANDLIEYSDNYLITSVDNTYRVNKKTLTKHIFKNLKQIHSTSILNTSVNTILIGTYGNGIYQINSDLDSATHIEKININSVKEIKAGFDENHIYLNTNSGIIVIDSKSFDIIFSFSNKNNLPTNNISDFFIKDSLLLCLSNYGITVKKEHPSTKIDNWNIAHISKEKNTTPFDNYFSYDENNLSFKIKIKSLTYLNKAIIKYKLDGYSEKWEETTTPLIAFKSLNPGNYNLLVKILSPDKSYSTEQKGYNFTITPPYWRTKIFYILITIMIFTLIYVTYKYNLNNSLRKEKINKLNYQLKLQAIQAQINPHFFSNVLTGIQKLILKKDIDTANEYIYNLGSLSRDIIASSKEDLWSLNSEIKLIQNYLNFEKIRFKDRFNYSINIDKEINSEITLIPSMIIQPLAENAIKHAFSPGEIGLLAINFKLKEDKLIIEVSDNGKGFGNNEKSQGFGLKIIKGKLNLIENIYKKNVSFEIIKNETGGNSFIISLPKNIKK